MLGNFSSGHYEQILDSNLFCYVVHTHSKLEILVREAGRELDGTSEWSRDRYNVRAVDELASVLAEDLELGHGGFELRHHARLVVCAAQVRP